MPDPPAFRPPVFELRPFALPEAETVAAWAESPQDVLALSGAGDPLTAGQVAAWTYEADYAFTLRRDGDLVAYGEVVEDVVEQDVEIQHLLVAPDVRATGVGRALLSRLCAFLAEARPYPEVWLRVGRDDAPAAACARAAGFEAVPDMSGPRFLWLKKPLTPPAPGDASP
jgi:GNAT superfamily N-acetyltransferase